MLTAPITRSTKLRLFGSAGTAVAIGLVFLLSQGGANADRIRTLTDGVQVLGSREFLIRAGMQMWRDNPFAGVGSGNFQHALVVSYLHLIPSWAQTTLSHTSVVSILAELGVVGAAMFAFVAFRAGLAMARAYFVTRVAYERLIIGWLAAGMLGIILQSQSEGRLLDDPFLWLLLAIFVAVETGAAFGGHARAASEQSPAHVAPAPGAGLPARPVPMRQPGAVARAPRQEPGA
jgi:O-antigen ligase